MSTFIWSEVSPRFKVEELFSPETINHIHLIDILLLDSVNSLAIRLDKPVLVNHGNNHLRGVRSANEQMNLCLRNPAAAKLSMHVQGKAVDVTVHGVDKEALIDAAIASGFTFFKVYETFIHFDTRIMIKHG